jgi:hypothetical protein
MVGFVDLPKVIARKKAFLVFPNARNESENRN